MNIQAIGAGLFSQNRQTWLNQYSFLTILRMHLKGTYTKLRTQHQYKKIPWVPSSTSRVANYLILLNKLTSKGAAGYLITRHVKVWCVCVCVFRQYCYINVEFLEKIRSNGRRNIIIYLQQMFSAVKYTKLQKARKVTRIFRLHWLQIRSRILIANIILSN